MALLDPDRLFPADERTRAVARALYETVRSLPVVSPHGHTDPRWFAENEAFPDPARLFVTPDHYIFRMLASQGIPLADLGVPSADGTPVETDGRAIWRRFASHYHLFRGTPTRLWLDHSFQTLFDIDRRLSAETADFYYDRISERLAQEAYRPRALFERFDIEVIATTESALDNLAHHRTIRDSGWGGRVVTTYRPDAVVDPDFDGFADNLVRFGEITGCDTTRFTGYLDAHRVRRAFFREHGATATDHGHPTALTADLSRSEAEALYSRVRSGEASAADREQFRAQMPTEMARLSLEDGMVMQIHAGSRRNHSDAVFAGFGRDKGFDIPQPTNYVAALKPLLDAVGLEPGLTIILFTLDETRLFARIGAAGRGLSLPETRSALVVLRFARGDEAVPRAGHRNSRLLQHRRFQRRHPRLLLDSRPARRRPAGGLRVSRRTCHHRPPCRGRGVRGCIRSGLPPRQGGLQALTGGRAIGRISVWQAMRTICPFHGAALPASGRVTSVPAVSLWLPSLFK